MKTLNTKEIEAIYQQSSHPFISNPKQLEPVREQVQEAFNGLLALNKWPDLDSWHPCEKEKWIAIGIEMMFFVSYTMQLSAPNESQTQAVAKLDKLYKQAAQKALAFIKSQYVPNHYCAGSLTHQTWMDVLAKEIFSPESVEQSVEQVSATNNALIIKPAAVKELFFNGLVES